MAEVKKVELEVDTEMFNNLVNAVGNTDFYTLEREVSKILKRNISIDFMSVFKDMIHVKTSNGYAYILVKR